jgi:microcin C transport system ATP-binding protein
MTPPLLSIEHLSVDYVSHGRWATALRDFSLSISPGEAVGLVGASGSGKSTVAMAILRLIRAQEGRITAGQILFEGKDLLTLPEESMRRIRGADISMIFQDPFTSLNPVLRIREQMQEILDAHVGAGHCPRPQSNVGQAQWPAPTVLIDSLNDVQLDAARVLDSFPHQLSGGQRQRVMIAMALLCEPKLILADEPTTALDVLVQKDILDLMARIQKKREVAMLLITHNHALLARYATRIVTLEPIEQPLMQSQGGL